jgi:non-canonical (house-cleaning) NTP pyrophosphatase
VGRVGKRVSGRRERDRVDPTAGAVAEFTAHGVERQALSPNSRLGALVNALDER